MNKFYLITAGVIISLCIIGAIILSIRAIIKPNLAGEIAKASAKFKENQYFRYEPAKKLVSHLEIGMTKKNVEVLLGKPNKKYDNDLLWHYTLGYSQFISIGFDPNGTVQKFGGAYAHLLSQEVQ